MINRMYFRKTNNLLKLETINLIKTYDFRYFVTLNFSGLSCDLKANSLAARFVRLLNERVFGKRSSKAVKLIFSLERHKFEGYHVHILVEDPRIRIESLERKLDFNYRNIIQECWESAGKETARISTSCPDGESWFKEITDLQGVAEYICKEFDQGREDVIMWDVSNLIGRKLYY